MLSFLGVTHYTQTKHLEIKSDGLVVIFCVKSLIFYKKSLVNMYIYIYTYMLILQVSRYCLLALQDRSGCLYRLDHRDQKTSLTDNRTDATRMINTLKCSFHKQSWSHVRSPVEWSLNIHWSDSLRAGHYTPEPVFSYKLRYVARFGLVEIAISTNPKPAIYRSLYENTGPV